MDTLQLHQHPACTLPCQDSRQRQMVRILRLLIPPTIIFWDLILIEFILLFSLSQTRRRISLTAFKPTTSRTRTKCHNSSSQEEGSTLDCHHMEEGEGE